MVCMIINQIKEKYPQFIFDEKMYELNNKHYIRVSYKAEEVSDLTGDYYYCVEDDYFYLTEDFCEDISN